MKTILGSLLMLGTVCAFAASDLSMNVKANDSQFVVKLPANPTTGYQWSLVNYDKTFLKMTKKHYSAPNTKLIGAGGTMSFTFKILKGKHHPQYTKMAFSYGRSWEPKTATSQNVVIYFVQ